MDIATLLGIASGIIILFVAIVMNTGASLFLSPFSMLVTLGGTIAATLITFAISDVIGVLKLVKVAFTYKVYDHTKIVERIIHLTDVTRRKGMVGLIAEMEMLDDEFLKRGLELVAEGASDDDIRYVLEIEIATTVERHKKGRELFTAMGKYAPGFGMIGTLIGLVQMLLNLDNPSNIGKPMAMALVTTFYGAILANLIFLPLAGKLKNRSAEETLFKELMLEGIILINSGESPRQVGERLKIFLPPRIRNNLDTRELAKKEE
ncbi:TPA: motility protein A [Candidatus Poribacteria bacterium]|nr:motility protein A [Candidatus Poribacteria bacterium]